MGKTTLESWKKILVIILLVGHVSGGPGYSGLELNLHAPVSMVQIPFIVYPVSGAYVTSADPTMVNVLSDIRSEMDYYQQRLKQDIDNLTALSRSMRPATSRLRVKRFDPFSMAIAGTALVTSAVALATAGAALAKVEALDGRINELAASTEEVLNFARQQRDINVILKDRVQDLETKINTQFREVYKEISGLKEKVALLMELQRFRANLLLQIRACSSSLLFCALDGGYVGGVAELFNLHYISDNSGNPEMTAVRADLSLSLKSITFTDIDRNNLTVSGIITAPVYSTTPNTVWRCSLRKLTTKDEVCYVGLCVYKDPWLGVESYSTMDRSIPLAGGGYLKIGWQRLGDFRYLNSTPGENNIEPPFCRPISTVRRDPCFNSKGIWYCDCDLAVCKSADGTQTEGAQVYIPGVSTWTPATEGGDVFRLSDRVVSTLGAPFALTDVKFVADVATWDDFDKALKTMDTALGEAQKHLTKAKNSSGFYGFKLATGLSLVLIVTVCIAIVGYVAWKKRRESRRTRR